MLLLLVVVLLLLLLPLPQLSKLWGPLVLRASALHTPHPL
jgi:hypothetical protein